MDNTLMYLLLAILFLGIYIVIRWYMVTIDRDYYREMYLNESKEYENMIERANYVFMSSSESSKLDVMINKEYHLLSDAHTINTQIKDGVTSLRACFDNPITFKYVYDDEKLRLYEIVSTEHSQRKGKHDVYWASLK